MNIKGVLFSLRLNAIRPFWFWPSLPSSLRPSAPKSNMFQQCIAQIYGLFFHISSICSMVNTLITFWIVSFFRAGALKLWIYNRSIFRQADYSIRILFMKFIKPFIIHIQRAMIPSHRCACFTTIYNQIEKDTIWELSVSVNPRNCQDWVRMLVKCGGLVRDTEMIKSAQ